MALALADVFVWDGISGARTRAPRTLRIEEGRLAGIGGDELAQGARRLVPAPAASPAGPTAIPGLIDAHVHLTLDPAIVDPRRQLEVTPEQLDTAMRARALAMLRAGITTARDLGGGAFRELELRDRIARGELPGPRLLCAGQPITSPGGHCHFWGGEAGDTEEIQRVVRRQVERGADWIKLMATGGVMTRGTRPADVQLDGPALETAVAAARAAGRAVAAHCHGTTGIDLAAAAGVRTVEHCSFAGAGGFGSDVDDAVVERLASHEALWVSPTVNAGWGRRREEDGRRSEFAQRMDACLRRLVAAGVRLIASTDAGIPGVEHHRLAQALPVLAAYAGLSPAAALRAATSEAARALGLEAETGALRPGLAADLLVVDGDPLVDLGVLERPLLVVARGQPVAPEPQGAGAGPAGGAD